jgi:PelA/Pel-15E family pectate lyase
MDRLFLLLGSLLLAPPAWAEDKPFTLLTPEHLAALSATERPVWEAYLTQSRAAAAHERQLLAEEVRRAGLKGTTPAPESQKEFEFGSETPPEWYGSAESLRLAAAVMSYQTPSGGWSKAVDYTHGPRQPGTHWTSQKGDAWHYCGTFDNRSTTEQIRMLARVFTATGREDVGAAVRRGLEYLLAAQYPTGGWPQNYPVEHGYHEAITLNDGAMIHVLEILQPLARGDAPFAFAEPDLRQRAEQALQRGIACALALQVRVNGRPTVWCAQHHPLSLEPVKARAKEPPSLSGAESAELVKFLMRSGPTTPEVVAAVEAALAWFESHRVTGLRQIRTGRGETHYVQDPGSTEVYWARFYDLQDEQPIFAGAVDGIVYRSFEAMAAKNPVAYAFFSTRPGDLLKKEAPRWRQRLAKTR